MFDRSGMYVKEMKSNLSFPMNIVDRMIINLISDP